MKIDCYTGGVAMTNGWVLDTPAGVLIIDAPAGMDEWLAARHITPAALFVTHQHFDHVQSAAAIAKRSSCPVYAWAKFSRDLTLERLAGREQVPLFHVPEFTVDHVLEGQSQVTFLGETWQLSHVPGHSLDSACIYHPGMGLLFGGDVLFQDGIGRTDFPGGSTELLLSGIQKHLLILPDMTRVFPGHGDDTTIGAEREGNPYLEGL